MISFRVLAVITSVLFFISCSESRWEVDVSNVQYDGEIHRLDQAIFALGANPNPAELAKLQLEYGTFLNAYLEAIMRIGPAENPMTPPLLGQFVSDLNWKELQTDIDKIHPDLDEASEVLERAFKLYSVFFETENMPRIVAYNSGFNVGVYPTEEWLGVGLEWYSGSDLPIIDRLPPDMFPQYKRDKMDPDYLAVNALKGWLMVRFQEKLNGDKLLNRLVYSGKIHFLAEKLLQETSLETVFNYSPAQLTWCEESAFDIWKHFLENDLLFSSDVMLINKLIGDGPFTPGMPPESPGGVGNWVGYKMVAAFMEGNEKITLAQLMALKNDQEILKYYKP